jgi:hypothetical protein
MNKGVFYIGLLLGAIIIAATFLPWATMTFLGESMTITGIPGDGIISLLAGILYIVMLFMADKKILYKIIGAVLALIIAMIGLNDLIQLKKGGGPALGEFSSMIQVGIGVWLVLICGVIGILVIFFIKPVNVLKSRERTI